jgi:hypothetical protein
MEKFSNSFSLYRRFPILSPYIDLIDHLQENIEFMLYLAILSHMMIVGSTLTVFCPASHSADGSPGNPDGRGKYVMEFLN